MRASLRRRPPAATLAVSHRERSTTMLRGRREQRREERETFGRGGNAHRLPDAREDALDRRRLLDRGRRRRARLQGQREGPAASQDAHARGPRGTRAAKIQGEKVHVKDTMEIEGAGGDRLAMVKQGHVHTAAGPLGRQGRGRRRSGRPGQCRRSRVRVRGGRARSPRCRSSGFGCRHVRHRDRAGPGPRCSSSPPRSRRPDDPRPRPAEPAARGSRQGSSRVRPIRGRGMVATPQPRGGRS